MLAAAAVGTVEYRSMTEPIRTSNPTIENYIEGKGMYSMSIKEDRYSPCQ